MMKRTFLFLAFIAAITLQARPDVDVKLTGKTSRSNKTVEELCQPSRAQTDLNLNNVRTTILGGGDMWWDLNSARYEVPKDGGKHSMFAGALWLGGLDEGQQLKLAGMTYRSSGNDFWPGPLSNDGLASVTKSVCDAYDRHWVIHREQVEMHRAWLICRNDVNCDVADKFPGYEGNIPDIILDWPAHGVDSDLPYALAPFIDLDGDERYDPLEDYPAYDLDRQFDCRLKETDVLYGDQTIWWVYNDRGNIHTETGAGALGFEIRAQAFAFATNDEINNMTFYNYRILNKSTFRLTNTYFSTWFDPDLGNYLDDIIGCDIPRGLGYCYNADLNDEGPLGYGLNPPAVGFDFFQGPFADYFDGLDNDRDGCIDGVRDDNGNCVAENPVTGINERIVMSGFMYYNNTGSSFSGNPDNAAEFYNYMQSRWMNGNPLVVETPSGPGNTSNGDGFTSDGSGLVTKFAYPGITYDTTGNNDPIASQNWFESPANQEDKRGLHNAGPFSLAPGALNFITTGVVWARDFNKADLFASVDKVIIADDKAQSLFDNCFQILNGPDAPDMDIQELDRELVLMLSYREGQNNDELDYQEVDPLISATDNTYKFEGFQVFQLANQNVSIGDRYDPSQARLIAQCDINNGVDRLINWELDPNLELLMPQDMTLEANDDGLQMSFVVKEDIFATGTDKRLVNHKPYYFSVVAYSYNEYQPFHQVTSPSGQRKPFLSGRNNVKLYEGLPHLVGSESDGTIQNAEYGFSPVITRLEGTGNGGNFMLLDQASEDYILQNFTMSTPTYVGGYGPVNVKVVDPLKVPSGRLYLIFDGTGSSARWSIEDENGNLIVNS
ncbi:MAG: T9SS C-terminal target domain-containing protein, partial [Schleiferiaceae bacterium]|nr:T9SS C-terminal target domain-containing protein [Schleiferiaceae bacterium]